ncbi:MAG: hypothetical protein PHR77_13665 [Kiritimatiellae bacterium]|nr:hypothetical protein [Kiritimatiellia bacterium]MDD5520728.1 hypothetical protein [Kiritimatiellia bacterium]
MQIGLNNALKWIGIRRPLMVPVRVGGNMSERMNEKIHALNCFPGGLAPFMIFDATVAEADKLVKETEDVEFDGSIMLNPRVEIAFIGLLAYFEAFCKGQFASILNICPRLLRSFGKKRGPVSLQLDDLFEATDHPQPYIGFLLSEQYNFAGARQINGLFRDLIQITPFSKDEAKKYDQLLQDRHLLVHNGGIYTLAYARQRFPAQELRPLAFRDSLLVKKQDYFDASAFLSTIVRKITNASYQGLEDMFRGRATDLPQEQYVAIGYLKHLNDK